MVHFALDLDHQHQMQPGAVPAVRRAAAERYPPDDVVGVAALVAGTARGGLLLYAQQEGEVKGVDQFAPAVQVADEPEQGRRRGGRTCESTPDPAPPEQGRRPAAWLYVLLEHQSI